MSGTYSEFIQNPVSEKIVLAHIEPAQRPMVWDLHAGSIYQKALNYYVLKVEEAGIELTQVDSILEIDASGKWFFDDTTKILYLRTTTNVDPTSVFIVVTYRLFFSNAPISLPYDLDSGREVYYEPLILTTSNFASQLENNEQIGIALEGDGSINLCNNDGFFLNIYDKLFWENKDCRIYSTTRGIPASEAQIIYEGIIEQKTYKADEVTFSLKDFISVLRNSIPITLFDGTEGTYPESIIGKPKRRIYGRVAGLDAHGLNNVLDGFQLTGTWSSSEGSSVLDAIGGAALDEATIDDEIYYIDDQGEQKKFTIVAVNNDNSISLESQVETLFTNKTIFCNPKIAWRKKNREWFIAEHALREPTVEITSVISKRKFTVTSTRDIKAADFIEINGQRRQVKRITGNTIRIRQSLSTAPSIGDTIVRPPINTAQYLLVDARPVTLNPQRDFTYTNTNGYSSIIIDELAEFNLTQVSQVTGTMIFANGSRDIIGAGTAFKTEFKPRDWIASIDEVDYFEVLQVIDDETLQLRIVYSGTTKSTAAKRKTPSYIDDKTHVILDVHGRTFNGEPSGIWVKTGADAVKDMLIEAGLEEKLNVDSFDNANDEAAMTISLCLPEEIRGDIPIFRDAITTVNQSVFGSLHKNADFEIEYNVLSNKKPETIVPIRDSDIISWSVQTDGKNIVSKTILSYRPQDIDPETVDKAYKIIDMTSDIATYLIKTDRIQEVTMNLYEDVDARTALERKVFFNEISQSILKVTSSLNLANKNIGDVLFFKFDRLYTRFGSLAGSLKIGVISGITTNGLEFDIELDDLASFFLTVGNITKDTAADYEDADEEETVLNGYIVNDNELIDPLEFSYRSNSRIG